MRIETRSETENRQPLPKSEATLTIGRAVVAQCEGRAARARAEAGTTISICGGGTTLKTEFLSSISLSKETGLGQLVPAGP